MAGGTMTLYVLLTNLTDEGRKTIKERPERIREVNQEVAAMGVTVIAQLSVELGSRGTLQVMSMPAMPLDDFIATIKGS
jgi:uncharacterized protein with GYD domain